MGDLLKHATIDLRPKSVDVQVPKTWYICRCWKVEDHSVCEELLINTVKTMIHLRDV
jgi:hypothetical protein